MKTLEIKAVVVHNKEDGSYLIHGCSDENSKEMFAKLSQLWHFDPASEDAHYVEFALQVSERETELVIEDHEERNYTGK